MKSDDTPRYIDLTNDYAFKLAFANPDYPDLTLGLVRALLPERNVESVELLVPETIPEDEDDKRMCFDIRCTDKAGDHFVVEMQKEKYSYFPDRLMAYSGDPLKRLLKAGQRYDTIRPLFIISVLDYFLDKDDESLLRSAHVKMDDSGKILSDKLNYVFLQLPAVKELRGGQPFLEQLAYSIRHIGRLKSRPGELEDPFFDRLFRASTREYINKEQLKTYDYMIRDAIQIEAEREYAISEALKRGLEAGIAKGREEGKEEGLATGARLKAVETARNFKVAGVDVSVIAQCTGLTVEELDKL